MNTESYACLSYALNELGYDVNHDLPGIDRPDEVNKYYRQLDKWLTEKDDEKRNIRVINHTQINK